MTFAAYRRGGLDELESLCAKWPLVWRKPGVGGPLLRTSIAHESMSLGFMQRGRRDFCAVFISVLSMVRLVYGFCDGIVPEDVVSYWGISEYVLL